MLKISLKQTVERALKKDENKRICTKLLKNSKIEIFYKYSFRGFEVSVSMTRKRKRKRKFGYNETEIRKKMCLQ